MRRIAVTNDRLNSIVDEEGKSDNAPQDTETRFCSHVNMIQGCTGPKYIKPVVHDKKHRVQNKWDTKRVEQDECRKFFHVGQREQYQD